MGVKLIDLRTIVHQFDSTTGLSSVVDGETLNLFTSAPDPAEDSGHIGMAISEQLGNVLATISAVDLSSATLIYFWGLGLGTMENQAGTGQNSESGFGPVLGDGTDTIAFGIAGGDIAGFRHSEGVPNYQCFVIDTTNLPAINNRTIRGVEGSLTLTALTEFGMNYSTESKALGGGSNCFTDILRYGNGGLIVIAGTGGAPGKYTETVVLDRDPTNTRAFGILREVAKNVFEAQGALTHGGTGSIAVVFRDQDGGLFWRELVAGISAGIYKIIVKETTDVPADAGTGVTFTDGGGGNDQIVRNDGGSWITDKFVVGGEITVANATTGANNGTYDILAVTATTIDIPTASITGDTGDNTATFAGGSVEFKLGILVGSGDTRTGANGFDLIGTVNTPWEFDASDADLEIMLLYGGTMKFATDGVTFSNDATNAANHDIAGWTFDSCTQVVLNRVPARNATFAAYSGVDAALLWNANIDIKNCNFNGNTDGTNDPAGIEHPVVGTFPYNGMKFSGNDFDILNSATAVTEDTYNESNQDGLNAIGDTVDAVGQTFVGANGVSSSCYFYLKKTGSPTGTAVAKIYSVTGTPGSGATPNALLATSQTIDVSTLTGSYVLRKFEFTGAANQITLVTSTDYFIVIEYTAGSAGNVVDVGVDTTSIEASTNLATFAGTWTADNTREACYYVSTGGIVIITATDSDPVTSRNSGSIEGIVDIRNSVALTITVEDESEVAIQNAQTSIYLLDSPFTELMNEDTTAGGIATENYAYFGDVDIKWRVRKSETTDNPRYFGRSGLGKITSSGFTQLVTMKVNPNI